MLRMIFIAIVVIHGLIHSLGFLKAFGFAEVEQLILPISSIQGMMWLFATVLFLSTVIEYILNIPWWWISALMACILSQVLIIMFWEDAKYGTIANVIIIFVAVASFAHWQFNRMVYSEVGQFISKSSVDSDNINELSVRQLPHPVQNWLNYTGVIGKEKINQVHLWQSGALRFKPDGKWIQFKAEQWFRTKSPGFIWNANVGQGSYLKFTGRDKYVNGKGEMLIKAYSLIPVVNSNDVEITQGAAVRYLSEIIWFPSAALSKTINWHTAGENKAVAQFSYEGSEVEGIFTFNEKGQVVTFQAVRYYESKQSKESWKVEIDPKTYRSFEGIKIPTEAKVVWQLEEGDFNWLKVQVEHIEYK